MIIKNKNQTEGSGTIGPGCYIMEWEAIVGVKKILGGTTKSGGYPKH